MSVLGYEEVKCEKYYLFLNQLLELEGSSRKIPLSWDKSIRQFQFGAGMTYLTLCERAK